MRILYLRTSSFQCVPHVGSILQFGEEEHHEVSVFDYTVEGCNHRIVEEVIKFNPTHIIWLGVCGGPTQPHPDTFLALRNTARTIALIPEASHPDWDPILEEFHKRESFDLIVNLDGNHNWNHHNVGHTTVAMFDQRPFKHTKPWEARTIDVGFCGGCGFTGTMRARLIDHLKNVSKEIFNFQEFQFGTLPYQDYADFLMDCKIIVNPAGSSGEKSLHVKGRIIEAGFAGCYLLEQAGSPLDQWMLSSLYSEFSDPAHCEEEIKTILKARDSALVADVFKNTVSKFFHPVRLWSEIFQKLA